MGTKDSRIDAYIDHAAPFAQPVLRHLRKVVHAASPDIDETMKWGFPHFMREGILCSMAAFKQHCAFGFWKASVVPRDAGAPVVKAMGQFGRITSVVDLPPRAVLIGYVREAIRLNEAGERTAKPSAPKHAKAPAMPADFRRTLAGVPAAWAAFAKFSPSQRREYLEWITGAKRDETRARRISTAVEWIAAGKPRRWKYMPGRKD